MKLKCIVEALNHYYSRRFPNATGWFIGKESVEPTKLNAYKKFRVEIFYHIPGKNFLAYQEEVVDRCPEGVEEELKDRLAIELLDGLFSNLKDLDKYETVQIPRV